MGMVTVLQRILKSWCALPKNKRKKGKKGEDNFLCVECKKKINEKLSIHHRNERINYG